LEKGDPVGNKKVSKEKRENQQLSHGRLRDNQSSKKKLTRSVSIVNSENVPNATDGLQRKKELNLKNKNKNVVSAFHSQTATEAGSTYKLTDGEKNYAGRTGEQTKQENPQLNPRDHHTQIT